MKKKILGLLMVFVMALSMTGCSGKEGTKTFAGKMNGNEVTVTYSYKGDEALKQSMETKILYSMYGVSNAEEMEKFFEDYGVLDALEKFNAVEGYSTKIEYKDDHAIEITEVDYTVADLKELAKNGMNLTGENPKDGQRISMKKTEEYMESQGFKEVK